MAFSLTNTEELDATLPPIVDSRGRPARIDGVPVWNVSDDTVLEVIAAADGLSAILRARGPEGSVTVSVEADADLTSGRKSIFFVGTGVVLPGAAIGGEVGFGAPREQASTPPPAPGLETEAELTTRLTAEFPGETVEEIAARVKVTLDARPVAAARRRR